MELLAALTPVVEALEQLGIAYRIGGSVASSLHGEPRSTNDVDLVADVRMEHVQPLCRLLAGQYYAEPELLKFAVHNSSCCNFIHLATAYKVDIFVRRKTPYDQQTFLRSTPKTLVDEPGARTFEIATPEDTILRKLMWYRDADGSSDRQWRDILGILRMQQGKLDQPYLDRWAAEIQVADLLARARREAG